MNEQEQQAECPECLGATVLFQGKGWSSSYKICSRYQESGHKSEQEIQEALKSFARSQRPSGRMA